MPVSAASLRTDGAIRASSGGFGAVSGRSRGSSSAALMGAVVSVFWSGRPVGAGVTLLDAP
jgi:hypothetical protein